MEAYRNGRLVKSSVLLRCSLFLSCLIFVMTGFAKEPTFAEIMDSIHEETSARETEGIIRSIDLVSRTGIIGGHKYWFGPPFGESPLQVYMFQSEGGALELLSPGMAVSVVYGDTGSARIALIIRQLADDSVIEN